MLAWFRKHPAAGIGVLVGLTCVVMAVLWDLISLFLPRMIPYQDFVGRNLLVVVGIGVVLMVANRRDFLRR